MGMGYEGFDYILTQGPHRERQPNDLKTLAHFGISIKWRVFGTNDHSI